MNQAAAATGQASDRAARVGITRRCGGFDPTVATFTSACKFFSMRAFVAECA